MMKTDAELLEAYCDKNEPEVLQEIINRYSRMIYNVCWRILRSHHDAEDATQAVLMAFFNKIPKLRKTGDLDGWFYMTAIRTARYKVRSRIAEQKRREEVSQMAQREQHTEETVSWEAVEPHLDEALSKLSSRYRRAVVLRGLESRSNKEAAALLGVAEQTFSDWYKRGLELLRERLGKVGVNVTAAGLPGLLEASQQPIPAGLKAQLDIFAAAGPEAALQSASPAVKLLKEGTMQSILMTKVKMTAAALMITTALGGGGWFAASQLGAAEDQKTAVTNGANGFLQWRGGPSRDGVLRNSPKLLDKWPEGGPKLLWESEVIPGERAGHNAGKPVGGSGSVVASGNRAIFYAHCRLPKAKAKYVFTTEDLVSVGWVDGIPDTLVEKINVAHKAIPRVEFKEPKLGEHVTKLMETLTKEERSKYGDLIQKSFRPYTGASKPRGLEGTWTWDRLYRLYKVRDKEFSSFKEWFEAWRLGKRYDHWGGHDLKEFLQGSVKRHTDTIICLDTATGKTVWQKDLPGDTAWGGNVSYACSSTPAISGDRCFVTGSAGLYCLAVKDGTLIWKARTYFSNSSPLVKDGKVYNCFFDGLAAHDAKDGRLLWRQPEVRSAFSSPAMWSKGGRDYLISSTGTGVVCLDPGKGSIVWKADFKGGSRGTPAISDDMVVLHGEKGIRALKLSPQKGETVWSTRPGGRGASPLVYQGMVYAVCGNRPTVVRCHDLKTGEQKWDATGAFFNECGSTTLADGKIFSGGQRGRKNSAETAIFMFKASPEKYEQLGKVRMAKPTERVRSWNFTTPAVADGKMYVRWWNRIACYDLRK